MRTHHHADHLLRRRAFRDACGDVQFTPSSEATLSAIFRARW